jgi:hypothetical protein
MSRIPSLLCLLLLFIHVASAQVARDIELGRDVGDGNIRYNSPYDPAAVSETTFIHPTEDYPYYEIVVPMGDWTEGTESAVKGVKINGRDCESYYVFVDGFSHVHSAWITHKSPTAENVVLVARMLWHDSEENRIEVDLEWTNSEGTKVTQTKRFTATAPSMGGGPAFWHRYQSFVAEETVGIGRTNEPVEFTVTVRAENCGDLEKELRVCSFDPETKELQAVPFQVFNYQSFPGTPPGTENENYLQHPSKSVSVALAATVPARDRKVYLVFYDNPEAEKMASPSTDLKVTGPRVGAVVENHYFRTLLSGKSGQIAAFDFFPERVADAIELTDSKYRLAQGDSSRAPESVPRITNSYSYAVHWNPDSFSDNGMWGHTFSWDPPDKTVVDAHGALLYRVTNSGRMPEYTPQVHASVTYSFFPGVPYMLASSVTEVRDPLNTSAIRNGEIVLDSHLVTHFVWQNKQGEIERIPTLHGPNWQDEWTHRVDHDVRWIAMTNELDGWGVGTVVLDSLSFNPISGQATQHRPAFYLYYHHFWQLPLTYFTRAWVYPFSDYQRGPILPVAKGSTYLDRMAFVPFLLQESEESRYSDLVSVSDQLHNPLRLRWGR